MIIDSSELYDRYMVQVSIRERIDGGVPKDPALIKQWVKATTGHDDEQTAAQVEEHVKDLDTVTEEKAEAMWCGFKSHEGKPYVEARQVKAMLRECATVLGITKQKRGSRQIIQHGFEVKGSDLGSRIFLEQCGTPAEEEKAIHVMTPQGPRNAIRRTDYYGPGTTLRFEIWILKTAPAETRHLGEKDLRQMLALAQENGLGANRSQGSGKLDIIEFKKI